MVADTGRAERATRRAESFDEVAELYAAARPTYPEALVTDLIRLSGLERTHNALEIGAGTGQLTTALAERGISLVAIETRPQSSALTHKEYGSVRPRQNCRCGL